MEHYSNKIEIIINSQKENLVAIGDYYAHLSLEETILVVNKYLIDGKLHHYLKTEEQHGKFRERDLRR